MGAMWDMSGIPNIQACGHGSVLSCIMAALPVLPIGKIADAAGEALQGVWDLGNFERGVAIEQQLGHNVPAAFPAIDIWDEATGAATSIKSLNLEAKTYQSASVLSLDPRRQFS